MVTLCDEPKALIVNSSRREQAASASRTYATAAGSARTDKDHRPRGRARVDDVWCALPKVVFRRALDHVRGNARLARAPLADEVATALAGTDKDVEIGGAGLASTAINLGLVDELRLLRHPIILGGGTPFLPPVTDDLPLELIETRTFGSRVIYERYRCASRDTRVP